MRVKVPKLLAREVRKFDFIGWFMSILGLCLMAKFGGIGWIFGTDRNWWWFALVFFIFFEYMVRVSYGRIYKYVYYDTVIHRLYELEVNRKTFYVCAENSEELDLYMELTYPGLEYTILKDTHLESYIKEEEML